MVKGKLKNGRGQQVWGPRYKGINEDLKKISLNKVCCRQWSRCVEVAFKQLSIIPSNQVLNISYESMMEGDKTIKSIIDFLKLDDGNYILDYFNKNLITSNNDKWRNRLTSEDLQVYKEECYKILVEFLDERKEYFL